ncbi:MAG: MBL fold metallo-hydrolase [Microcoleaceae cyanobacterium]
MNQIPIHKPPQPILENVYAFPPNRETLGATAYLIVGKHGNILVDSPAWDDNNSQFVSSQGGLQWLCITHRNSIGKAKAVQQATECKILIQEQEAYLLPEAKVTSFHHEFQLDSHTTAFWTPGYSPGSSCLYSTLNGGILFTGRHLLPNLDGQPIPLRTSKTFHWGRQLRSVERIIDRFAPETLHYICPGANTGALRGKRFIDQAHIKLTQLDFSQLQKAEIPL